MAIEIMTMVFYANIDNLKYLHEGQNKDGEPFQKNITVSAASAKSVLLAYADHSNADGESTYPSLTRIEVKTGLSRVTVIKTIRGLVENGFLFQDGVSNYGTNNYRINIDKLAELQDKISPMLVKPVYQGSKASLPPVVKPVYQGGKASLPEPSIHDETVIYRMSAISSAFWTASKIPEPAIGGRGWQSWNDGVDALMKIEATPEEVAAAVEKLDALGYGYTDPGSTVKTIVNMRKPQKQKADKKQIRPLPKGL